MTAKIQVTVMCDSCGHESDCWGSVGFARASARRDGWKRRKIDGVFKDFCDYCQDQLDNAECEDALALTKGTQQ